MNKLKEGLWLHSSAKPGGKFQRIIDTWEDMEHVRLGNPAKTLIVPPNSISLKIGNYGPVLSDISKVFGNDELIFRSDADFEDVDGKRSAGVLESIRCYIPTRTEREKTLKGVVDSLKSPAAQAYIRKHGIKNPRVGAGIQTFVRNTRSKEPDVEFGN